MKPTNAKKFRTISKRIFFIAINPFRKTYWLIFKPKTKGVKCLLENDGKFLMIRNTYGKKYWTFPGGGVNKNEKLISAAHRESREEVGINPKKLSRIGDFFTQREYKKDTVYCYYSKVNSDHFQIDKEEVLEAKWFPPSKIPSHHSPTVDRMMKMYQTSKRSIKHNS